MKTADTFDTYTKAVDKSARLVSSYLEDDYYYKLIKTARLKPIVKITSNSKLKLINHWIDEFGNSFIIENKKIKYLFGDIRLLNDPKIKTDICFGLKMEEIFRLSKILYCGISKNYYELCFLGDDNYLRSYLIYDDCIQPISPLYFKRDIIEQIFDSDDNKKILTGSILRIADTDHYITKIPSSLDVVNKIMNRIKEIEINE